MSPTDLRLSSAAVGIVVRPLGRVRTVVDNNTKEKKGICKLCGRICLWSVSPPDGGAEEAERL